MDRQTSQSWFPSEDNSRLRSQPQAKPVIWTPAMLFKSTEILCGKIVSRNHTGPQGWQSPALQRLGGHKSHCSRDVTVTSKLILQSGKGDVGAGAPRKTRAVCCSCAATRAGCRRNVEAGIAACPPALLEALGLAMRRVKQEASPLLSSQLSSAAASSRHNQIGNLYPSFLPHLAPCSAPTGA